MNCEKHFPTPNLPTLNHRAFGPTGITMAGEVYEVLADRRCMDCLYYLEDYFRK
jgi:hypothetical protein